MVYCFKSENRGYNDTYKVTIIGLSRTTEGDKYYEAGVNLYKEKTAKSSVLD